MVIRRKMLPLFFTALVVLPLPTSSQRLYKKLRPSSNYWDRAKRHMYLVVTDMEGYRDSLSDRGIKDHLSICSGNSILWEAEIPVRSRIEIEGNKLVAVQKRKGRILRNLIPVPHKFTVPIGKVSAVGG